MSLESNRFFQLVRRHADSMLEVGRGETDGQQTPLFAGVVDAGGRKAITGLTAPPPGVRISDYNWCGNNMMHDLPLLETLRVLSGLTGDERYGQAVDAALDYYGEHCPHPVTGLFPWGEHAQWSFADHEILPCHFSNGLKHWLKDKYLIHDHLAFAPAWFWQGLWETHPDVVVRFAHGLNGHIVNAQTFEHNRHGQLGENWWHDPNQPGSGSGKDFARHSGFFIFDCLFAYARSGDSSLLEWARRKIKWHMERRLPNGLVSGCVRTKEASEEGQHDSLALSLADAADVLGDCEEGREFRGYANELFEARKRQRQGEAPGAPNEPGDEQLWICGYFRKPHLTLQPGNISELVYARSGSEWYAQSCVATARWLAENLSPPPQLPVMARRYAQFLDIMLGACALTGNEAVFVEAAGKIGEWAERDLYRNGLLMGCSNQLMVGTGSNFEYHADPWTKPTTPGFYFSVTNTSNLLRNLLRLSLLQEGESDVLGPDVYRR